MSGAKKIVPKRRFKEFLNAGDWEQRKLNDLLTIRRGLTYKPSDIAENGIRVLRSSNIDEDQFITSNDDVFVNIEAVNIPFAKNGDILITSANGSNRLVGKHTIISDIADNSAVHGGFMLLAESNNPLFTDALLSSNWYKRFINTYVAGGNGAIGNLSKSDLESQTVMIPSEHEQAKIGQWYDNINQLITLHQRKLDKLQATKKALLQEMFPEEGQDKPKRRFKGFTDAWEQRKLGECMDSFEYGLNAAAKEYDGMHKYIRITDIDDETHNFIQNNLTSPDIDFNSDVSDYKLNINDIVFARTGASVGKTYLYNPNDGDLYYAGFLIRGKVNEACDAGFVYQNTLTGDYDSFIRITSQRSGQPGVNSKEYATFRLNIPCKGEQEKISKLLSSLDKLFTLHQRKLDKLKNLKQAYLNEMFV